MLRRLADRGVDRIAVGFSGGPDSVALLHALASARPPHGPRILAVHVDHQVRPESAEEVGFCARLAAEWSLPFRVLHADKAQIMRGERASEGRLRKERYRLFSLALAESRFPTLLLAHHLDDQLETILLAAIRGAGLRGLRGMVPRRPLPSRSAARQVELIRPFLRVQREAILRYVRNHSLPFLRDPSNQDLSYRRNYVRHVLLPSLREDLGVHADAHLVRLGRTSRALYRRANRDALASPLHHASSDTLHARIENVADRSIGRRLSLQMQAHLRERSDATFTLSPTTRLQLRDGNLVRVDVAPRSLRPIPGIVSMREHAHALPLLRAIAALSPSDRRRRIEARGRVYLDAAAFPLPLTLRQRCPGDRFHPHGLDQPRKLKDLLIARKVPRDARDGLAVIVDASDRIVAVEGLPPAAFAILRPDSERVLRIVVTRGETAPLKR